MRSAEGTGNASDAPTTPPQAVTATSSSSSALDLQALRAEMRVIARQEISASTGAHVDDAPKKPARAPTAEQKRAATDQTQLLAQAIKAGAWTDRDVVHLRAILPQMAPDARFDALRSISQAINRGQLRVDARPPF